MGRSLLAAMALEVGTSTIGDLAIRLDHSPSLIIRLPTHEGM